MICSDMPDAVRHVLSDSDVWWQNGQRSTIQQFLSQYTLHDSYWVGIQFQHDGSCQAIIKFDIVHVDPTLIELDLPVQLNNVNEPHYTGEWPYLFIDFPNVHQVLSDHSEKYVFHNGIGHASTKILTAEQRMSWLDFLLNTAVVSEDVGEFLLNESVHCTTFVGVSGNHIHLIHSEPTQFLCIKLDGSILHLPGLMVSDSSI